MKHIGYRNGYRIQIQNGFYEVSSGNRIYYYGYCRKNSTIQEIANKTILQDEVPDERKQRNRTVYSNTANYIRNHNSNNANNLYMMED